MAQNPGAGQLPLSSLIPCGELGKRTIFLASLKLCTISLCFTVVIIIINIHNFMYVDINVLQK